MDYTSNRTLSLHQFYADVALREWALKERRGQAMFNHLLKVRPELAEAVRATDMDPFYESPAAVKKFIEFIETRWYQNII